MRGLFLKHRVIIFRIFGVLLLVIGVIIHFWSTTEGIILTENEIAAANIARMEASVASSVSTVKQNLKQDTKFVEELKILQDKQTEQITLLSMAFGIGFLIYSFMGREKEE